MWTNYNYNNEIMNNDIPTVKIFNSVNLFFIMHLKWNNIGRIYIKINTIILTIHLKI